MISPQWLWETVAALQACSVGSRGKYILQPTIRSVSCSTIKDASSLDPTMFKLVFGNNCGLTMKEKQDISLPWHLTATIIHNSLVN